MIIWLVGVALLVLAWGLVWQRNVVLAFGVLLGLPIAWIASLLIKPFVTGMKDIPTWLPPIPFATVAITLFIYGTLTWFRADRLPPPPPEEDEHEHGH